MDFKAITIFSISTLITFNAFCQNLVKRDFDNLKINNLKEEGINTEFDDRYPMILPDGLTMYFSSNRPRPDGQNDLDIYVTHRRSNKDVWNVPIKLNSMVNSSFDDHSVTISTDGHYMYFGSNRSGNWDLFTSYRKDVNNDFGWNQATNMGPQINSESVDLCPYFHQSKNETRLYFPSNRAGGVGQSDIYYSILNKDKNEWQAPIMLEGINSTDHEKHFEPTNGLIWSSRTGGKGKDDIWIASFDKAIGKWGNPSCLEFPINTENNEGMPSITKDNSEFYFHSDRPSGKGGFDIYYAIMK
ncbi:MAG: hypothetical protein WD426_11165 [Anditalea sp.]